MVGTTEGQFNPNMETSRSMIVTILYRLAGSSSVNADNPFKDVEGDKWYSDAITWAAANKIVGGYQDGNFGQNDTLTC